MIKQKVYRLIRLFAFGGELGMHQSSSIVDNIGD
jgi:hypothetical protein